MCNKSLGSYWWWVAVCDYCETKSEVVFFAEIQKNCKICFDGGYRNFIYGSRMIWICFSVVWLDEFVLWYPLRLPEMWLHEICYAWTKFPVSAHKSAIHWLHIEFLWPTGTTFIIVIKCWWIVKGSFSPLDNPDQISKSVCYWKLVVPILISS